MKPLDSLPKELTRLEKRITKNLIKAQREVAQRMKDDAVQIISTHGTGEYAKTIKVSKTVLEESDIRTKIYTDCTVQAKVNGNVYNLGRLLEHGTKPHIIEPYDAKALRFEIDGRIIFASRVRHPGSVAVPHFTPALNKNKTEYKNLIRKAIKESVNG